MNKQTEAELLDRITELESKVASLQQVATDSTRIVDRISQLENQVAALTPKSQPLSPTDQKVRSLNESKRRSEIDSMVDSLRKSTIAKPPEPPLPSIAGKSFYSIDHRTIPIYGSVDLAELAEILGTSTEAIEDDADNFDLSVPELVKQVTRLEPRLQVDKSYRFMRSPV